MLYFTADIHADHQKMAELRGFQNISDMQEAIICSWNEIVTDKDDVIILGDVVMFPNNSLDQFFSVLRGRKSLVPGNHDHSKNLKYLSRWMTILPTLHTIKHKELTHLTGEQQVLSVALCHYPMLAWPGDVLAFGHLHGDAHRINKDMGLILDTLPALDVGWDVFQKPLLAQHFLSITAKRFNQNTHSDFMKQ